MNVTQQGIATLLRCAITQESLPLPEGFDLEQSYPLIRRHQMMTLIYAGAANCKVPLSDPAMRKLFQDYGKNMLIDQRQMAEVSRIFAVFDENDIDYMPLKGCKLKALYPSPELRVMGDADILIRMEQYDRIRPIMLSLGFAEKGTSDHELPWEKPTLYLELHKRVIPSYNKDFYSGFGEGWDLAKIQDGNRYSMTPEDEFVYLFTHFAKHYRDGGIGCRHLVDLWVYLRANPALDDGYIRTHLKKLGLLEFYDNILKTIRVWFADGESDGVVDFITEFILSSGSWGAIGSRALSRAVRDSQHTNSSTKGKLAYILTILFPGVEMLKDKYTVLKKAPFLLPVIWLIRPFYKILFERKSLKRHEINLATITPENMQTRQQLLNYVGLDYNF